MPKTLTISIVIPAYNEEDQLAACLDAIAAQTVQPNEVIVVDNNSTDQTVAIAHRYPFVKVMHETRQGPVYARDCGFNASRGDIIGRLDGDSIIASNWVETVLGVFANPAVEAASGEVSYRDVGLSVAFDAIDKQIRNYLSKRMGGIGEQFLYGVNMAIRRTAWQQVSRQVCHARHLHEDLDLAVHLSRQGSRVVYERSMRVSISPRQAAAGASQFLNYVWSNQKVFTEHNMRSGRYIFRVALLVSSLYVPIHLLYKGYDPTKQRFSLPYLLANNITARVSPVSESV